MADRQGGKDQAVPRQAGRAILLDTNGCVLLIHFAMGLQTVLGDADNRHTKLVEFLQALGKADGLFGAARGIVLGIKIDHVRRALEAGRGKRFTAIGGDLEGRCSVTGGQAARRQFPVPPSHSPSPSNQLDLTLTGGDKATTALKPRGWDICPF